MRLFLFATISCLFIATGALAQRDRYAADAFLVSRMVEKFHVQPRPMDESFSAQFFDRFFRELDAERLVFTAQDMVSLLPYRNRLADEVRSRQNGFLKLVTAIYERRIRKIDTLLLSLRQQPFNFTIEERLTVAEDSSYPANTQMQQIKLAKLLKKEMLGYLLERANINVGTPALRQKKIIDSLEPGAREKIVAAFQRTIQRITQGATGITASLGNLYCQSLAASFDPHSAYMPKTEKENFESGMGQRSMRFGFSLEQEADGVYIHELRPGSAAYKSGQINPGDKFVSIQWDNKEPIDVSEASIQELSAILEESNYGKMILTFKKMDGVLRKVELQKEIMDIGEDENKVKSFLLKNAATSIGYISLPAFYTDWEHLQNNIKGCANDVAKEIIRLKKENIDGLIFDLRYNGGGSMQEAVELSGIFIDAGPVAQVSLAGGKLYTLKDVNRGTIYDGPLLVLVNGASASASELVAGTLQDYHRAVIMGTPTYGKATGQEILPLDTLARPGAYSQGIMAETFLKLTIEKLYRITGATAQGDGVIPDIQLPDLAEWLMPHESAEPAALQPQRIEANRFYTPYQGDNLAALVYRGRALADTSAWYMAMKKNKGLVEELSHRTDISLRLQDVLLQREKNKALERQAGLPADNATTLFTVQSPQSETEKLKLLPGLQTVNEQWKNALLRDHWIETAFGVLSVKK